MAKTGVKEGDLLFGKYRVERVIGSGGMGIVVAARHEQLDQLVAIKFVREEALGNPDAATRFLREARAAASLKSEHVAKVLDVGVLDSGVPYMVMEFLEGSDLGKIMGERGPLPVAFALRLLRQACMALAEAHSVGIVHRDLKPQNLFLTNTPDGGPKLKVLDFGISKTIEGVTGRALTKTSAVLGSPLYMAPEQMLSSRDVDARVDVWSLGVVLFELLTGRYPFEGETYAALCVKIAHDPPCPLSTLRADVHREVVAIIDRCLEKDATRRFANAAEVAAALDALGPNVLARSSDVAMRSGSPSTVPHVARPVPEKVNTLAGWGSHFVGKVKKGGVMAIVGVVFAAAGGALVFVALQRRPPSRTDLVGHAPPAGEVPTIVDAHPIRSPLSTASREVPPPPPEPVVHISPQPALEIPPHPAADGPSSISPLPPRNAPAPTPQRAPPTPIPTKVVAVPGAVTAQAPASTLDNDGIPSRR